MNTIAEARFAMPGTVMGAESAALAHETAWPVHCPRAMARDFLLWRHLRVIRARAMRHVHRLAGAALPKGSGPARTAYGVEMHPNWSDKTYAYCHYGTYGRYLADLIGAIDVPFAFLDIGANQGLFSLIAGRNHACERIVALDPVPGTWARLKDNLALAGLEHRAEAIEAGLSDRSGTATIAIKRSHSGVATLGSHLDERGSGDAHFDIDLVTAAQIAPLLPEGLPIMVKIDVEGHEATVIEELLRSHLAGRIFGIFYEHDDRWSDAERIERALSGAGFDTRRRYGRGRHYDVLATRSEPYPLAAPARAA